MSGSKRETAARLYAGLLFIFLGICLALAPSAHAVTLPPNFREDIVFSGLTQPLAVSFSPDGRIFVAEKSGIIKAYTSLSDTSPDVVADLRTQVHDFWDRGLLGMALHPNFPATNALYVLYTYDAPPGGTAPVFNDNCADATGEGCVVTGRLSRLTNIGGAPSAVSEQVLIHDWCQQYPSHSIGSLAFGPDGALYVSGGDGASFTFTDYGQKGNPCGDPPGGVLSSPLRRGRRSAQPGPAHVRGSRRPWTARSSAWIRQQAQGSRTIRWPRAPMRTPAASSRTASGTRSG